jgi:UDP-N-acetylmuramate dehydrogenase
LGWLRGQRWVDVPMARYTSLRVGGPADMVVVPATLDELLALNLWAREADVPVTYLGNGTNLLVRSGGLRGVVVSLRQALRHLSLVPPASPEAYAAGDSVLLRVGAGVSLTRLVHLTLQRGLVGLGFVVGIPGTLGGAIAMNAGTELGGMWDAVVGVQLLLPDGHTLTVHPGDVSVGYRCAKLPPGSVVLEATLRATQADPREVREDVRKLYRARLRSQPLSQPNAGSIFKNPPGQRAGRLIDQLGLKGYRIGDAQVSHIHANFIVNLHEASADDVLALIRYIQGYVHARTGVLLEEELNVVGE